MVHSDHVVIPNEEEERHGGGGHGNSNHHAVVRPGSLTIEMSQVRKCFLFFFFVKLIRMITIKFKMIANNQLNYNHSRALIVIILTLIY